MNKSTSKSETGPELCQRVSFLLNYRNYTAIVYKSMCFSLSRRLLALLIACGILLSVPATAYDSDWDDDDTEKKSSTKKKKKKSKKKDDEDYWDDDSWDEEPVSKKKKKSKKKKSKKKGKKKSSDDDWDDDNDSDGITEEDEEDFFSDEPSSAPAVEVKRTALGTSTQTVSPKKADNNQPRNRAECIQRLKNDLSNVEHSKVRLRHSHWSNDAYVNKEHKVLLNMNNFRDTATVITFTDQELRVKWDRYGEERFLCQPDGIYALDSIATVKGSRGDCVHRMINNPGSISYVELMVKHPEWHNTVRINMEQRVLVNMNQYKDTATVISLTERELRVKWDGAGEERFLRQPDNTYMLNTLVANSNVNEDRKTARVASRLMSRKAIPWEEYGWSGKILDYITGNEPPLTYKTFRLISPSMNSKVRFAEKEMVLVKLEEDKCAAKVLNYTGVKMSVRWPSGHVATFKRFEENTYRKIDEERIAKQILDNTLATRQKSEDDWFQIWWRDVMDEEKPLSYVTIELKNGQETSHPRICMDNRLLVHTAPHQGWATVVQFNRNKLIIRWYNRNEEIYERGDDNIYHRAD